MFKLKRYGRVTNWAGIKFVLLNYGIIRRGIVTAAEYESEMLFIKAENRENTLLSACKCINIM